MISTGLTNVSLYLYLIAALMTGTCRLFGTEGLLRESHIYPAFAVDYLKRTGSKYLRAAATPNMRQQDAIKLYLLSHRAEQDFSVREKWFAEKVFIPYMDENAREFHYNESLYYFAVSFLWRILIWHTEFLSQTKNEWYFSKLLEVKEEWRHFLASYSFPQNHHQVQLFFTDRVKSITAPVQGFDYYVTRAFDGTIVSNERQSYLAVYGKFLRFVFWCVIKSDKQYTNDATKIDPINGILRVPQQFQEDYLMDFLTNRSNQYSSLSKPSEAQQEKILAELLKDKEKFWASDAGKAIYNDHFNLDIKDDLP